MTHLSLVSYVKGKITKKVKVMVFIKNIKKLRLPIWLKNWSIVQITEYEKDKYHMQDNCKG